MGYVQILGHDASICPIFWLSNGTTGYYSRWLMHLFGFCSWWLMQLFVTIPDG